MIVNKIKSLKINTIFLFFGYFGGCVLLILLCFSAYFWNDDFFFYQEMHDSGNWKTSIHMYYTWDGRGLSLNTMLRNFSVYYISAYGNALLATAYLFLQGFILSKLIINALQLNSVRNFRIIQFSLITTFLLWLVFRTHIAFSHYWATGTIYATQNLLFLLWIYLYVFGKDKFKLGFLLLTFLIPLGGVFSSVAILMLLICDYIFYKKHWDRRLTLILVVFIPSLLINVLAPGNYMRFSSVQGGLHFELDQYVMNYFEIVRRFIMTSLEAVFLGILIGFGLPGKIIDIKESELHRFWTLILLAAFSSLIPFALMPAAVVNYVGIHFQSLMFLWVLTFTYVVRIKLELYTFSWKYIEGVVIVIFLVIASIQWIQSKEVNKQIRHRHIILSTYSGKNTPVYLPPLTYKDYFFSHLSYDIWGDPNEPHNLRLQELYQTGPVIARVNEPTAADTIPFQKNFKLNNYLDKKFW